MERWLILAGLVLVIVGLVVHYAPGAFSWFVKLPGDIRVESERGKFFFPITSMAILSADGAVQPVSAVILGKAE